MTVPSPWANPPAWDKLRLGDLDFPGVARVKISRSRSVEKKQPKDTAGATTTIKGANVADVSITVRIGRFETFEEDWETMCNIVSIIDPVPGRDTGPYDICHPKAELRQVRAVVVEKVEGPEPVDNPGGEWEWTINCSEYNPAKTQNASTPNASKAVTYTTANQAAGKEGPVPPPVNPAPPANADP